MLVYFFPNNGDHAWSCGCASAHHWREPGCISFETILLLSHPSVRFGVWVIFIWIVRFKLHGWYWPHHHRRLQPSAARNPPLPAAVSHLWDGCPWSYTFQNQWVHPYPDLLFSPSNLWEISSTRGEKTWQIWSIAVRKPLILFSYYYDFPPVVLGLHLMITMLYILGESLCTSKFSRLIISIGIRPSSDFVVFVFDSFFFFFYLKLASLSCLLSGALNAKICFMVSVPAHLYPLG